MQKRPIGYEVGKASILDRRVPKSTKYEHVESKLAGKIGTTIKDIEFMSNKETAKKKGEMFYRLKPSTLWKMLHQENESESVYNWSKPDQSEEAKSTLTSVTIKTEQLPTGIDTDFLLVDLREPEEFAEFHVKEALNYPGTHIKRDKMLPQLYQYKNKEDKIIVVYHFDEKKGIPYVIQLFEKGFDNLYLLNGGIEGFAQEIQDGLQGSKVPQFAPKDTAKKFRKKRLQ